MKGSLRALALLCVFVPSLLHAVTVTVQANPSRCGQANGSVIATPSGGLPPYIYSWSNGTTTQTIAGLLAGDYTVTVTDGLSNTAQATGTVTDIPNLAQPNPIMQRPDCSGSCSGWVSISEGELQGTAPYTYDWFNPFIQFGQATFMGVCASLPATINVTDATGCPGSFEVTVWDAQFGYPMILGTTPACGGQANGSATIEGSFGWAYFQVSTVGGGPVLYVDLANPPYTISGLAAGTYEVLLWDQFGYPPFYGPGAVYCTGPTQFTIGTIPAPCGSISGTVYHDADQNCVLNGFDLAQPYRVITIDPVGAFAISDGNGNYQQSLNYGNYDLSQSPVPMETQICPAVTPQPLTIDAANTDVVTDFANLSTVPHDLVVSLWSTSARPGFPTEVWVWVHNNSAFPSGTVDMDLSFDALLANPVPASGQWSIGVLPPYGSLLRIFEADVPANINLLGTVLTYTTTVGNATAEVSVSNNTASQDRTITGSYDPNDKQGATSTALSPSQYFLAQDEWIDYTVRFQNTGTATAETVTIRDVIDDDLFIPSLEILGASHAFTPSFGQGRELIFTFDNIDLPDSTTDLLGSQGFISYRIKPNSDIVVGDVLENTAGIYFDANPPIITNTVTHVVDFSTGMQGQEQEQVQVLPNPVSDVLNVIQTEATSAIEVFAIDGRCIKVPSTRRSDGFQLDVRELPAGLYYVRTAAGTARFVKQ